MIVLWCLCSPKINNILSELVSGRVWCKFLPTYPRALWSNTILQLVNTVLHIRWIEHWRSTYLLILYIIYIPSLFYRDCASNKYEHTISVLSYHINIYTQTSENKLFLLLFNAPDDAPFVITKCIYMTNDICDKKNCI